MPAHTYSAGTAFLTVVPSFLGVEKAMEQQVRQMAQKVDKSIAAALPKGMAAAARGARGSGARAGQEFGGAYEAAAKKILTKAYTSLPEYEPDMKLDKWQKAVKALRKDMKDLADEKFGPDLDEATFAAAVKQMEDRARALRDTAPKASDRGFFDLSATQGQLSSLNDFVEQAAKRGEEAADGFGGAFQRRMADVLGKGVDAIPKIKVDTDTAEADAKLQKLRADMESLSGKTIGVDISAAAAYAELRRINDELGHLDRKNVDIQVRTNARAASGEIADFISKAEGAGTAVSSIGNASNFSMTRLGYLIALGASLGSVLVPAGASAAAMIGQIGTMALAAGAGLGVFALGVSGISDAVKAMGAAEEDQSKSATKIAQANRRLGSSADGVRMAELSLANTRANIADQEFDAAQRVADATRRVADARRDAGERAEDANRRVKEAQRDVTDAEEDAVEVRRALNDAIRQATQDIAELDTALARNAQDQSKATTAQLEALEKLNALKANPRATEVELRKATDAYNEQTVRLKELADKRRELTAEQERAAKLGVEGDERVIAVRKRIADADERVARAKERRDLAELQRTRDAEDSARQIAEAQRGVVEARRAQDRQARDAAYQLASATRAVEQAQNSAATAAEGMGTAGGAALEKMNEEMDKLSPAGQRFAKFIFGLKDEARGLRDVAQENLLPGLERAITMLMPYLPGFSRFVGNVAAELGRLAVEAVKAFGNPTWQKFFQFMDREAVPTLGMMFEVSMNFTEALLNLFLALTPFNKEIGGGLVKMSEDFARWAAELGKSQGYQEFLEYVRENGPKVLHFLGELGLLLIDLVQALAPIGSVVLTILNGLVDGINSIPIPVLTTFLAIVAGISATLIGLGAAMKFKRTITELFGPTSQRAVQTYAYETGRATAETGKFRTAVATAAGFSDAAARKVSFLGDAARTTGRGLGVLAETTASKFRSGMDVAAEAAGNAGTRMSEFGEKTRGARNYLAYLGDDLAKATVAPALGAVGSAADRVGQKMGEMGENVRGARNYLSYLADDLARGPLGPQFVAATTAVTRFGGAVKNVGTKAISGMRTAGAGLMGLMGGPWGLALAGATVAITSLAAASADYNGKIDSIASSLDELGKKYLELDKAGKIGTDESTKLLTQIAQGNPEMQKAVLNLGAMGIAIDELGKAAAGSSEEISRILGVLDEEIDLAGDKWRDESNFLFTVWSKDARAASDRTEQLRQLREAVKKHYEEVKRAEEVEGLMNSQTARGIAMAAITKNNVGATTAELAKMATQWDQNQIAINGYNQTLANFGSGAEAATRRANDLSAAIERQYGAAISANEANEKWHAGLITLRESVASNGRTLDINTRAGQSNRDAIQQVAQAAREMFIEEVRAGGKLPEVTAKHADRITKLRAEANNLGLTKRETDKLIKTYGQIDPSITTKYNVENFDVVYMKAQEMRFAQEMLERGITDAAEAKRLWKSRLQALQESAKGNKMAYQYDMSRRAVGGPIVGPGTGTSDDVLILASNGEHMLTAAEVEAAGGHEAIYAWRNSLMAGSVQRPKDLPRYARGGAIAPFPVEFSMTKLPTRKELEAAVWERFANGGGGTLGGDGNVSGWRAMERIVEAVVPSMSVSSDYRQGDPGYHGKGRAIDMVFSDRSERRGGGAALQAFNFIASNYGAKTKELIWDYSPWGLSTGIWNGGRHRFGSSTSGPGTHDDHIHWAFDDGGWMMPGMQGVNLLREPEPVLTPGQWSVMEDFVRQGMAGANGNTYQFEFANTTLDAQQLRDIQAREDALARIGRGR